LGKLKSRCHRVHRLVWSRWLGYLAIK